METGISSYTYTWAIGVPNNQPESCMTVYQLLDKAFEHQVLIVQIADNLPLGQYSDEELKRIKEYSDNRNIRIEVGARKMTPANLKKYIGIASFFKSPILRFVIDGDDYEPELNEVIKIINNVLPSLKENNIVLAIENHDRFLAKEFVQIIENTDKSFVGICLDSVNSMGAGEGLETVIELLAPYTVNLHIKEFSINRLFHNMGFVIEGKPLGEGMLPVKYMVEKVPHRCRSAIIEQWVPLKESLKSTIETESSWATQSIQFLKEILVS